MIDPSEYQNVFKKKSLEEMIAQFNLKHRKHSHNKNKSEYMYKHNTVGLDSNHKDNCKSKDKGQPSIKSPLKKYNQSIADRAIEYTDELERFQSPQGSVIRFDNYNNFLPKKQFNKLNNNNSNNNMNFSKLRMGKYERFIHLCRYNDKIRNILTKEHISPHQVNYNDYFSLKN